MNKILGVIRYKLHRDMNWGGDHVILLDQSQRGFMNARGLWRIRTRQSEAAIKARDLIQKISNAMANPQK